MLLGQRLKTTILIYLSILLFFSGQRVFALDLTIDSLLNKLNAKSDSARVDLMVTLSYKYLLKDTAKSDYYRRQALEQSRSLNYTKGMGWCYYLEGVRCTQQNRFLAAINSETQAISIGQTVKDYDLIARSYNAMGLANLRLQDHYNALKSFNSALNALAKAKDKTFEGAFIGNIGISYIKNKKIKDGLVYMKKASLMHKKSGNKTWLADSYLEMGLAYDQLRDYKRSLSYGSSALNIAREVNVPLLEVRSLILLGSIHVRLKNLVTGEQYITEAYNKSIKHNFQPEILQIYKVYSNLFEVKDNYKLAFLYQKKYAELYDTIYNAGRSNIILEYQEKFQAQQKELENKQLRTDQLGMDIQIKQKNTLLNYSYIILGAFSFFSLSIFWANRRIKEKNRLLTLKGIEIQRQKEQVEHINHIKDKLFSVIAHDLRSPFASMKSMMDVYEDGMMSKEEVGYFFKEISKDIGTNNLLLDNLLAWAKTQLHGFKTHPKTISLARITDEALYHFNKLFNTKDLHINNQVDYECIAYADYEMTKTIIRNLIGNAIKFTPKKGSITITCNKCNGELIISVKDSGIGIPQDKLDKLFQDNFFTTQGLNKEKGTGLGLKICKEFIEKNNGRIWVESKLEQGTTFFFTLPESTELLVQDPGMLETEETDTVTLRQMINKSLNLQNKYDRYELISKATNDIIWDSDLIAGEISWNEALAATFGHPFEKTTIGWWNEMVHPDDLPAVRQSLDKAIREQISNWESEYRFRCADNSYKYVFDRGRLIYDDNGLPFRMIGLIQDVDVQKHAMRELQRLSVVATNVNNLVLITDAENRVMWVNRAFEKYTGYTLSEILGKRPRSFLSGECTDHKIFEKTDACVANHEEFSVEMINYTKSGKPFWVQVDATPYDDPITMQTGYIAIQTVITERKENERTILRKNKTLREIARISSHEVRRPLSSILGLTKLLENNMTQDELDEYISMLNTSGQQLDILIHRIHQYIADMEAEEV